MLTKDEVGGAPQMKEVLFKNEEFNKKCSFDYDEKKQKYGKKDSTFRIISTNGIKEEILAEKSVNITPHVGKGVVKEKVQMSGKVYFIEFEILIENMLIGATSRQSMKKVP